MSVSGTDEMNYI